jgi:hypothetical protein
MKMESITSLILQNFDLMGEGENKELGLNSCKLKLYGQRAVEEEFVREKAPGFFVYNKKEKRLPIACYSGRIRKHRVNCSLYFDREDSNRIKYVDLFIGDVRFCSKKRCRKKIN